MYCIDIAPVAWKEVFHTCRRQNDALWNDEFAVCWIASLKQVCQSAYLLYLRPDSDFKSFNRLQMAKENSLSPTV